MARSITITAMVGVGAVAMALVMPTAANASDADAVAAAALAAAVVNPDAAAAVPFSTDATIDARPDPGTPAIEVAVDDAGDASVAFGLEPDAPAYLEVIVDQGSTAEPVEIADDGQAVVLAGDDAPDVVVAASEAGTSIQAVLASPAAGDEIRFDFVGTQLRVLDDGSAEAFATDAELPGVELLLAAVATPWAFDANGTPVETWFEADGSTLVQHLTLTTETAYPVIADPYTYYGSSFPQIRWTWAETVALNANRGDYGWIVAACGAVLAAAWPAALVALAACGSQYSRWSTGISNAYVASRCFAVVLSIPGPNPSSYACLK